MVCYGVFNSKSYLLSSVDSSNLILITDIIVHQCSDDRLCGFLISEEVMQWLLLLKDSDKSMSYCREDTMFFPQCNLLSMRYFAKEVMWGGSDERYLN